MERLETIHPLAGSGVLLLRPSMLQVVTSVKDMLYLKWNTLPPDFQSQQAYFMPINDARPGAGYTGSHWSLLVFIRPHHTFYYYDSLLGRNFVEAQAMARRMTTLLNLQEQPPLFQIIDTPSQENAADCGVYVMVITEKLVQRLLRLGGDVSKRKKLTTISRRSIASAVDHQRKDMVKFIWSLRRAQFPPLAPTPPSSFTDKILHRYFDA
ncbi:hypothetical protein BX666DRAFT_2006226 [Dichotomocladium elegans]|nr:hypothetical protein BX666DRAFT_2006226 [Dichotomocladium elegans]